MFVSRKRLRRTALSLNALSCIAKQGDEIVVKSVISHSSSFSELDECENRERNVQSSSYLYNNKKKKLQVSLARVCHNSLRDSENKFARVFLTI